MHSQTVLKDYDQRDSVYCLVIIAFIHIPIPKSLKCYVLYFHRFDIVLDAAGVGSDAGQYAACLKQWANAKYITLRSPLLKNFDEHGLVCTRVISAPREVNA